MKRAAHMTVLLATVLLVMLSWATTASAAQTSSPGNSEAAHLCQQGGYQSLHRANGSSFSNPGQCTSYAAQGGVFAPVSVPLTNTLTCNPFNDFYNYSFAFGPGATSGLTSLSYIFFTPAGTYAGTTATGTITLSTSYASSLTPGSLPLSYVRSNGLTETSPGTYQFNIWVEYELTPATLTVSDSNGLTGSTTVPVAGSNYCPPFK